MNLFLLDYNNYYNRTIKKFDKLSDYEFYIEYEELDINFNPNDGIMTEHVCGGISTYSGDCNYAIVSDPNSNIVSRWFIIENQRTRAGQYKLILKRDVIADHYDDVMLSDSFIEKGWVPQSDPAIFNKENMSFNQIKLEEKLIQDDTKSAWIVGYYAKGKSLNATIAAQEYIPDYSVRGLNNWEYYHNYINSVKRISNIRLSLLFGNGSVSGGSMFTYSLTPANINFINKIPTANTAFKYKIKDTIGYKVPNLDSALNSHATIIYNLAKDSLSGYESNIDFQNLIEIGTKGKTILDEDTGDLYRIGIELNEGITETANVSKIELTSNLGLYLYDVYKESGDIIVGSKPTSNSPQTDFMFSVENVDELRLTLTLIKSESIHINISASSSAQIQTSPYNIFAMPYSDNLILRNSDNIDIKINKFDTLRLANSLIAAHSGNAGELYDVQLLPYCPLPEVLNNITLEGNNVIVDLTSIEVDLYNYILNDQEEKVGIYFNCRESSLRTLIELSIKPDNLKISNETTFCRLVSPNWNGTFEFSPAKNRGVDYIEVDMELKPYQPYIHVCPKWKESGLYGKRDRDAIGLICGGDFGLTMINDAWATYERSNKNYQAIFDRGIQNLEVQHRYQRVGEIAGAAVGTVQGATSGAMTGAMIGGGYGAAAGAVIGGVSSAAGGVIDYTMAEELRSEAIDYTKDLFGFQLGNIRALPDSLTKVNSFNPNNKIFPFIEFYGCTEEEIEALKNKIKFNGMTVGRIGYPVQYLNPNEETYLKAQLIKIEISEDSHFVNEIANELFKGVRI